MELSVTSLGWEPGGRIPEPHTADGEDHSPRIQFAGVPAGVQSFALVFDDPDAPGGTWVHWVIYDIPGAAKGLPEGVSTAGTLPDGSRQGRNSWKKTGYGGPSPPPGAPHRYFFRLYALPAPLGLGPGLSAKEVESVARAKSIEAAQFMGIYRRS